MTAPGAEPLSILSTPERAFPAASVLFPRPISPSSRDGAARTGTQGHRTGSFQSVQRNSTSFPTSASDQRSTLLGVTHGNSFAIDQGHSTAAADPPYSDEPKRRAHQLGTYQPRGQIKRDAHAAEHAVQGPPSIQGHGVLVVLEQHAPGTFKVHAVSENSQDIISKTPGELFALGSFTEVLSKEQEYLFLEHIDSLQDTDQVGDTNVFSLSFENAEGKARQVRCAAQPHHSGSELLVCEFEIMQDVPLPAISSASSKSSRAGSNSTATTPSVESDSSFGRPRMRLSASRRPRHKLDPMGILHAMSQVQEQLAMAGDVQVLVHTLANIAKEVTGFDRVLVCQYDHRLFGRVVAEVADIDIPAPMYEGLRFHAIDVFGQAQDLHRVDRVSLLYDRHVKPSRLIFRPGIESHHRLNLDHAYLRSALPIHPTQFEDMNVRSAMSIPIQSPSGLWGTIICHSSRACGARVSFLNRKLCRLIGDSAWTNIARLSSESRMKAWNMIRSMRIPDGLNGYRLAPTHQLLGSFRADSGFLVAGNRVETLGHPQHLQEALVILRYLMLRDIISVITSTDLATDFPDLHHPSASRGISGIMVVPLCLGGDEFMVFFRDAQPTLVGWASTPRLAQNPTSAMDEKPIVAPSPAAHAIPLCDEWSSAEIETAAILCLLSEKASHIQRLKQHPPVRQGDMVAQLLLGNSAHELRTPLNAVINYLELARQDGMGAEIREHLKRSSAGSKALVVAINGLLGVDVG